MKEGTIYIGGRKIRCWTVGLGGIGSEKVPKVNKEVKGDE